MLPINIYVAYHVQFPVNISASGQWKIVEVLTMSEADKKLIKINADELVEERDTAVASFAKLWQVYVKLFFYLLELLLLKKRNGLYFLKITSSIPMH